MEEGIKICESKPVVSYFISIKYNRNAYDTYNNKIQYQVKFCTFIGRRFRQRYVFKKENSKNHL